MIWPLLLMGLVVVVRRVDYWRSLAAAHESNGAWRAFKVSSVRGPLVTIEASLGCSIQTKKSLFSNRSLQTIIALETP